MSVTLEQMPAVTGEAPALSLAELPDSYAVAQQLLDAGRSLRDSDTYRQLFYEQNRVVRTPLEEIDRINDATILVKKEYLQDSGSYKRRGATNAILRTAANTVESYSTGNHGRSVVEAARRCNKQVILHVPKSISEAKLQPLQGQAEIRFYDTFIEAQQSAEEHRDLPDTTVIPPFGDEHVIAGQMSLGYEIVEDIIARGLQYKNITIPVTAAGGGHLLGVALPVREAQQAGLLGPNITIVGVQPENTDALGRAVAKVQANEEPVGLFNQDTLDTDCDALAIGEESLSPMIVSVAADKQVVDGFASIDKLSLARARQYLSNQVGTEIEPAAALPMAYALAHASPDNVLILPVTGKNISSATQQLYDSLVVEENIRLYEQSSQSYSNPIAYDIAGVLEHAGELPNEPGLLSGPTAQHRTGLVAPIRTARYIPTMISPDVDAAYKEQLSELGIELLY